MMAKIEKRKGIWYAKFKDSNGNWKYKSCGKGIKKSEALLLASRWETEAIDAPTKAHKESLSNLFTLFLTEHLLIGKKGLHKAKTTIKREQGAFKNFIRYVENNNTKSLDKITTGYIIRYLFNRRDTDGASPKTQWEERRVIRNFFIFVELAEDSNIPRKNPVDLVPSPTISRNRKRYFSKDELSTIIQDAVQNNKEYAPVFEFLYLTGIRSGEIANLRWADYDEEHSLLYIRGSSNPQYEGNKFYNDTEIPTSKKVVELLNKQRGVHSEFVFTNSKGNQLRKNQVYKILWTILKRNDINGANVHTFRHTCASHLVIAGVSIYKVSKYLRHSSVAMTEIYAHLAPDSLIDDISIL